MSEDLNTAERFGKSAADLLVATRTMGETCGVFYIDEDGIEEGFGVVATTSTRAARLLRAVMDFLQDEDPEPDALTEPLWDYLSTHPDNDDAS